MFVKFKMKMAELYRVEDRIEMYILTTQNTNFMEQKTVSSF